MILSIDVGKKNLALCLGDKRGKIKKWEKISLVEEKVCESCKKNKATKVYNKIQKFICKNKKCEIELRQIYPKPGRQSKYKSKSGDINLICNNIEKYLQNYSCSLCLIENQPVLANPSMKTVQMLIFGYFRFLKKTTVQLINARDDYTTFGVNLPSKLKDKKQKAVYICKNVLNKKWLEYFNTFKKQDDLADSFLQYYKYIKDNVV